MGAHLVNLALARWAQHVSDTAFRVLVRMALVALDTDSANGRPAGLYFGGRELLLLTLRTQRGGSPRTAYRRVTRAVDELVAVGAIERVGTAHTGHRQSYRLTLDQGYPQGDSGGHPVGDSGGHPVSESGWPGESQRVASRATPRNHEEPQPLGATEESSRRRGTTHPRTRETAVSTPEDRSDKTDQCPRCGVLYDPGRVCGNRNCTSYGWW